MEVRVVVVPPGFRAAAALDTFAFKRAWGAYGTPLSEISTNDADHAYVPNGPMPKDFRGHLTLNFSNDGLVYAADRNANRIDVTTKQGKFLKEFILAPTARMAGSWARWAAWAKTEASGSGCT